MSAIKDAALIALELAKWARDMLRRKRPPLEPRRDVRPISSHPSATIITLNGERKEL